MPTFSPPEGFNDVSSYTFAGRNRRVIVRHTHQLGSVDDLLGVAADYASQLRKLFDAKPKIAKPAVRKDLSPYVVVTTQLKESAGEITERSAFILFRNGTSAQICVSASADDKSAEGFFESLVKSVQPTDSAAAEPVSLDRGSADAGTTKSKSKSAKAASKKSAARSAGPVTIDLPAAYEDVTVLKFRTADGTEHLTVNPNQPPAAKTVAKVAAAAKPLAALASGVATAKDDHGKTFQYEVSSNLWEARSAARAAKPTSKARSADGPAVAAASPAVGSEAVSSQTVNVEGNQVLVQYRSTRPADPDTAQKIAGAIKPSA